MANYYYYHNYGTLVSVFKHKSYLHRHLSNVNVCRTYLRRLTTPNDVLLSNTYLRMVVTQRAQGTYAQREFCGGLEHSHAVHSRAIN